MIKKQTDISSFLASGKTITVCPPQKDDSCLVVVDDERSSSELVLEALLSGPMTLQKLKRATGRGLSHVLEKLEMKGLVKKEKERHSNGTRMRYIWSLA